MKRFVVDTSIFTNPDIFTRFGPDSQEAIQNFLSRVRQTEAEFYMPRSIYEELQKIKDVNSLKAEIESVLLIRSPRRHNIMIPGDILYEFIDEVRSRIDRGLRIAEEHTRIAWQSVQTEDMGPLIAKLREKYREALRQGILDSREDADVVMLAYELNGAIISADEGLCKWADRVGLIKIDPAGLPEFMDELIKHKPSSDEVSE
ncbi:MAG: RNA ligase partner protein [Spirochaetia bacterium]|nr:RNA ligase partner protein [Spirochaetia bacterium]